MATIHRYKSVKTMIYGAMKEMEQRIYIFSMLNDMKGMQIFFFVGSTISNFILFIPQISFYIVF